MTAFYDKPMLIAELERDEGIRGSVYDDATGQEIRPGNVVKGNPTIGVGHNCNARPLSQPEIDLILRNDISEVEMGLDQHFPWWRNMNDVRQRVILNMAFNMGLPTLCQFKTTLADMQAGYWQDAAAGMRASLWFRQVGARAERLAKMMEAWANLEP